MTPTQRNSAERRQKGVVLIVALIMLLVMIIGSTALVRTVDTGSLISGNLAFKRGATMAADVATAQAIAFLGNRLDNHSLDIDIPAAGYYASLPTAFVVTATNGSPRIDWDANNCGETARTANCLTAQPSSAPDAAGNISSYVIHRLCKSPGGMTPACASIKTDAGDSAGLYRITTRISGPRGTLSFVETLVHFSWQ